jgi:hypothetical protein
MPVMTFDRPKALARIIISVSPPMGMSWDPNMSVYTPWLVDMWLMTCSCAVCVTVLILYKCHSTHTYTHTYTYTQTRRKLSGSWWSSAQAGLH